jgi:hypothetical protein
MTSMKECEYAAGKPLTRKKRGQLLDEVEAVTGMRSSEMNQNNVLIRLKGNYWINLIKIVDSDHFFLYNDLNYLGRIIDIHTGLK